MTSEERHEARYRRRKAKRDAARMARSQAQGDFYKVFRFNNLYKAGLDCSKGVKWKAATQRWMGTRVASTAKTHAQLMNGTWKRAKPTDFTLCCRGKIRQIKAPKFGVRQVEKCFCDNYLNPILEASFISANSASVKGRGYDYAQNLFQEHLRRQLRRGGGYVMFLDFKHYFDSASHEQLHKEIDRRISDDRLRDFFSVSLAQFGEVGLNLGSQISQSCAMALPNELDHFIKQDLRIKGYGRFSDDSYLFADSREQLQSCLKSIREKCATMGLELNEKKVRIVSTSEYMHWLKIQYHVTESGKIIKKISRKNTTRCRRKLRKLKELYANGTIGLDAVQSSYASYQGHMRYANSWRTVHNTNLYFKSLFGFYPNKKGWENVYISEKQRGNCDLRKSDVGAQISQRHAG